MLPTLYKGSVKDLLGPVSFGPEAGLIFSYTDAYSIFDWGRMPDALAHKGEALAVLAAHWFERLADARSWQEFSRSPEALALRRANRFGATFNELGETLQREGLHTHYLGLLPSAEAGVAPLSTAGMEKSSRYLAVRQVSAVKPELATVLGRAVPDYLPTRTSALPRLVPLEVVFRFSCPQGSSLLERVAKDSTYLAQRGFAGAHVEAGARWEFPVLELFSKLEATDRPLSMSEALALSGISGAKLNELLLKTAWVAGWLRHACAAAGLELADGKLEWGLSPSRDGSGELMLVDAVGPDELRILRDGVQLSKEFLRIHYRNTPWAEALADAKKKADTQGVADWKKSVAGAPPALPPKLRELAGHLYPALTNSLTGRAWFPDAWALEEVVRGLRELGSLA